VPGHLRAELDHAPAGDVRLISLCAGQGRDVIGGLAGHPPDDVRARLVELDERNVAVARQAAQAAGLDGVEVLQADAGITDVCVGLAQLGSLSGPCPGRIGTVTLSSRRPGRSHARPAEAEALSGCRVPRRRRRRWPRLRRSVRPMACRRGWCAAAVAGPSARPAPRAG
jgi:hypothetical protein